MVCRSARAAASSCGTRSRSMPSTTCRWRRAAARAGGPPAAGPRAEDLYVALDGARVTLQGRGATRIRIPAGPHTIAAAPGRAHADDGRRRRLPRRCAHSRHHQVAITGPFNATGPGDTPSRRRVLICPASTARRNRARRGSSRRSPRVRIGGRSRSSRRRVQTLLEFYRDGPRRRARSNPESSERWRACWSIRSSCSASNASRPARCRRAVSRLSDLDLASRLSFFLWSSIPDDELLRRGGARRAEEPRSSSGRCGECWRTRVRTRSSTTSPGSGSILRELKNARPDSPTSTPICGSRCSARRRWCSARSCSEDRSVVDLLDSDFTFVDERLARHYGIPGVPRIAHAPHHAAGRQSAPWAARTGKHPHADLGGESHVAGRSRQVDSRECARGATAESTARCRDQPGKGSRASEGNLAAPAARAASCQPHVRFVSSADGSDRLALENFDNTGKWRTMDGKTPIDASSQMADGTKVNGPESLRRALLARSDVFVTVMAEKLLTYASGRAMRPEDMPAVRAHRRGDGTERQSLLVDGARRGRRRRSFRCGRRRVRRRSLAMFIFKKTAVAPDVPARYRGDDCAAISRRDGSCADAGAIDGGEPEEPLRVLLRPARRHDGQVDAGHRGNGLRVHRDP